MEKLKNAESLEDVHTHTHTSVLTNKKKRGDRNVTSY